MKRSFLNVCVALAIACTSFQARGQGLGTPDPKDMAHGAVLCTWSIYLAMKEAGARCFADADAELKAALEDSIARIDRFIMDNEPMNEEQFRRYKQRAVDFTNRSVACDRDHKMIYEALRKAGPNAIRDRRRECSRCHGNP